MKRFNRSYHPHLHPKQPQTGNFDPVLRTYPVITEYLGVQQTHDLVAPSNAAARGTAMELAGIPCTVLQCTQQSDW
jgi:hypothetical protein